MITIEDIQQCYKGVTSYPDLAKRLAGIGIESYTVEVSGGIMLYRLAEGATVLSTGHSKERSVAPVFNEQQTIQAVRNNQQGKTDYNGFMEEITAAGVRFYEATLIGPDKRVTYIDTGGFYKESIPQ